MVIIDIISPGLEHDDGMAEPPEHPPRRHAPGHRLDPDRPAPELPEGHAAPRAAPLPLEPDRCARLPDGGVAAPRSFGPPRGLDPFRVVGWVGLQPSAESPNEVEGVESRL